MITVLSASQAVQSYSVYGDCYWFSQQIVISSFCCRHGSREASGIAATKYELRLYDTVYGSRDNKWVHHSANISKFNLNKF